MELNNQSLRPPWLRLSRTAAPAPAPAAGVPDKGYKVLLPYSLSKSPACARLLRRRGFAAISRKNTLSKKAEICKVSASSHYQSKIRPDTLNYILEEELFWEIEAQKGRLVTQQIPLFRLLNRFRLF